MRRHRFLVLAALALGACSTPTPSAADAGASDAAPLPDGGADAGPATRCAPTELPGALESAHWDPRFTIAGLSGDDGIPPIVYDLAPSASGELSAVGHFRFLGATPVHPMIHERAGTWSDARASWELTPGAAGLAAIAHGPSGALALATYDSFGERTTQIWLDEGAGLRVIAHVTGVVRRLAFVGTTLWAAGPMTVDEGGIAGLGIWDGAAWHAPAGGAPDAPAYTLLVEGSTVLVGGAFSTIGGIAASRVASFDGTTWSARDVAQGQFVFALVRDAHGDLVAGGSLPTDAEGTVGGLLRWSGTAWEPVGGGLANGPLFGNVSDLVLHDGDLIATGCFTHAGGAAGSAEAIAARSVARWDGAAWHALDDGRWGSAWFGLATCGDEGPLAIFDATHQRLVSAGGRLYLGGSFGGVGGVASQGLAVYEGGAWHPAGAESGDGLTGYAEELAIGGPDCTLHALGPLTHAGGSAVTSRVLRWNDGWTELGGALPAGFYCPTMVVDPQGAVHVGCSELEPSGSEPLGRVVTLASGAWTTEIETSSAVQDLALDGAGRVWVVGGGAAGFVGRIENGALTTVAETDGLVFRVAVDGDRVLVGGGFQHVGDLAASRIALFDGASWQALGTGMPGTPVALALDEGDLYASCGDEGAGAFGVAHWDGTRWTELATPAHGVPSLEVFSPRALVARGSTVIAAGAIIVESGDRPRSAYAFDGTIFRPLGGGVGSLGLDAMVLTGDALWVAGAMAIVGPDDDTIPSVGVGRFVLR